MQIIDELEPVARGVYTGAIGCFGYDGSLDLNIAIRTAVHVDGTAYVQAGGGIVADSDPQAEYQETLDKARAIIGALRAPMTDRWLCVGGQLVCERDATVPATGGVLYGYGLFETMRACAGRVFRLDAHEARLRDGARILGLAVPFDAGELRRAVDAVLDRNGLAGVDAAVRLTLEGDPPPADDTSPSAARWIVSARALTEYPESLYDRGASAIVSDVRRNETSPLSRLKTLNYLDNLLARRAARAAGADEAILLNTRGEVAEGAASNVFVVRGGTLLTPPIDAGALPGIARATVLELAPSLALEPRESTVTLDALRAADEAFLTNSLMEVLPLTRLDGAPIAAGRPGPIASQLREEYRALATTAR